MLLERQSIPIDFVPGMEGKLPLAAGSVREGGEWRIRLPSTTLQPAAFSAGVDMFGSGFGFIHCLDLFGSADSLRPLRGRRKSSFVCPGGIASLNPRLMAGNHSDSVSPSDPSFRRIDLPPHAGVGQAVADSLRSQSTLVNSLPCY